MLEIMEPKTLILQVASSSNSKFGNLGDNALTWCIYLGKLDWAGLIVKKLEACDIALCHQVIAQSITESEVMADKPAFCMQLFGFFAQKLGGKWLQDMVSPSVSSTASEEQGASIEVLLKDACEKWLSQNVSAVEAVLCDGSEEDDAEEVQVRVMR